MSNKRVAPVATDGGATTDSSGATLDCKRHCIMIDATSTFLTILDLVFDTGVFELSDLQALMNTNKSVLKFLHESQVWKPIFLDDEVTAWGERINQLGLGPSIGRISKEDWIGPHIPKDYCVSDLELPPRIRARTREQPDIRSYYPHHSDTLAKGFVLAEMGYGTGSGLHRINEQTGVLEDLFHPADEDAITPEGFISMDRTQVYIPRELPILCHACDGVVCKSYSELVDHCVTLDHQLAAIPSDRRLPKEFWDPRNLPEYANKTPFEQVKVCLTYKHRVLDFLRAPMDDAGIRMIESELEWITDCAIRDDYPMEKCTVDGVTEGYVSFVVEEFTSRGMAVQGYVRDVILGGWGNFQSHGSCSSENLFFCVVGGEK